MGKPHIKQQRNVGVTIPDIFVPRRGLRRNPQTNEFLPYSSDIKHAWPYFTVRPIRYKSKSIAYEKLF